MSERGKWAEGISNGLVLSCSRCGVNPRFDYTVSDGLWRKIVTDREERLGVICLPCLDLLADACGENVAEHLEQVQFTGQGKTVVLRPEKTWLHDERIFIAAAPRPDLSELRALVERMRKLPKKRISQGLAIDPAPDALIMHRHLSPLLDELEALIERIDGHPRTGS